MASIANKIRQHIFQHFTNFIDEDVYFFRRLRPYRLQLSSYAKEFIPLDIKFSDKYKNKLKSYFSDQKNESLLIVEEDECLYAILTIDTL